MDKLSCDPFMELFMAINDPFDAYDATSTLTAKSSKIYNAEDIKDEINTYEAVISSPLFRLPRELRDRIHIKLITSADLPSPEARQNACTWGHANRYTDQHHPFAYLLTCKAINKEATPFLYKYRPYKIYVATREFISQVRNSPVSVNGRSHVQLVFCHIDLKMRKSRSALVLRPLRLLAKLQSARECHIRLFCEDGFCDMYSDDPRRNAVEMVAESVRSFDKVIFSYRSHSITDHYRDREYRKYLKLMRQIQELLQKEYDDICYLPDVQVRDTAGRLVFQPRDLLQLRRN